MRSGNPVLRNDTFSSVASIGSDEVMTIQGTVNKTFILLLLVVFSASIVWKNPAAFAPYLIVTWIGSLALIILTAFNKQLVKMTAPAYALIQGLALGCISSFFEKMYPGIVVQAVGLTFGTLAALLFAYKSRLIKPTENFKLGVCAATGGIFIFYVVSMILGFFGISMPLLHSSGPFGIGFSLVIIVIAALNLVLDFDFIENGAVHGAPKYMEWYGAFGLMVTLIWLYVEILRLLAKIRNR